MSLKKTIIFLKTLQEMRNNELAYVISNEYINRIQYVYMYTMVPHTEGLSVAY